MKLLHLICSLSLVALSGCSTALGPPSIRGDEPPRYQFIDLGLLTGGSSSEAYGIADSGDLIVGQATNSSGANNAVVWRGMPPKIDNLGVLGGGRVSVSHGVHPDSLIIGSSESERAHGKFEAFLWKPGTGMQGLGFLPGGTTSLGWGASQTVLAFCGWSATAGTGSPRGFVKSSPALAPLGTLPGGSWSQARSVNGKKFSVGVADVAGGKVHAFLDNGMIHDLKTLPGGDTSEANYIAQTDKLRVVGSSNDSSGTTRACIWTPLIHPLDMLPSATQSLARGANFIYAEQIVGDATIGGNQIAVLWHRGRLYNLNNLTVLPSDCKLLIAYATNRNGRIVGVAEVGGVHHGFLLVPP